MANDLKQVDLLPRKHLVDIARQRGIDLDDEEAIRVFLKNKWLPLSAEKDLTADMLIWFSILRFSYCEVIV
jgi:hypothetical protein